MNTKDKSNVSEAKVTASLLERGKTVLEPYGDNERYDLVVDHGDRFERVQVKTARTIHDGKAIRFNCRSSYMMSDSNVEKSYTKEEIDSFIVYSPDYEKMYKVDVEEAGDTTMTLRLESDKPNMPNIKWAEDYEY